jgi:hypothetical protein
MSSYRKTAMIVGGLFIFALVLDLIGRGMYESILNTPDFFVNAYVHKTQVIIGILLEFLCTPAIVLIPIVLFPVLKKHNESLALGYIGFRLLEGVLFFSIVIGALTQLSLSQHYMNAGASDISYFQTLGDSIRAGAEWTTLIYIIVFTIGALIFYYLLYISRLLPRFISVWGFVAAALLLAGALFGMFGLIPLSNAMLYFGPLIALNEIVLTVWLIVKGFNPSAIASKA